MSQKQSVITLNGKRYDSVTGQLLGHTKDSALPKAQLGSALHRGSQATQPKASPVASQQYHKEAAVRQAAQHARAHHPQHAKTLMRRAVSPPSHSVKRHLKPSSHTGDLVKQPLLTVAPKRSVGSVDEHRRKRSNHIARSKLITRFGSQQSQVSRYQPAPPGAMYSPNIRSQMPAQALSVAPQPSNDIFERALAHANSHMQPGPKNVAGRKKTHHLRRITGVVTSLF